MDLPEVLQQLMVTAATPFDRRLTPRRASSEKTPRPERKVSSRFHRGFGSEPLDCQPIQASRAKKDPIPETVNEAASLEAPADLFDRPAMG
jgi:hypothetical protein